MFKLSRYRAETPPVQDRRTGSTHRLVLSTRTEALRLIEEPAWQHLLAGSFDRVPPSVLADLLGAELLVPEGEDELKTVLDRNGAASADHDIAYLVIQPTASCQFGCGYCGQTHTSRAISEEHQDRVVELARARLATGRYRTLQIGWFGAEATLAISQIRALTSRLQAVAAEFGCRYDAKLVTNGYTLTPELAAELVCERGVSFIEITIDGSRDYHDRARPTRGGGPTFDRVFANAVAIARRDDLPVRLSIRCNVSRSNRPGALELLELLAAEGVQEKISIYAAPIHDWGNNARADFGSPTEEFAAWEVEFFIRALRLGFRTKLMPARKKVNCMVFMPGAEMIDAYGNRFNCTEVSYVDTYETPAPASGGRLSLPLLDPRSAGNRYATGHLDQPEEIAGRREVLGDFYRRVERGDFPCHDCRMLPVCGGMCPKSWVEGSTACPPAKFNIAERLMIRYALERGAFHDPAAVPA